MDGAADKLRSHAEGPRAPTLRVDFHPRDSRGLIWGYRLDELAPLSIDQSLDADCGPVWYHFNIADGRARKWLKEHSGLPEQAVEMMLEPHPRVRLQMLPQGLVGILEDLHHDFNGDPEGFGELRFFVDERRVISARRHPLKSVDDLHRNLQRQANLRSTGDWVEALVELLTQNFAESVRALIDRVDRLEDEVVDGRSKPSQRAELASIRRLLVRFRRHVHADRQALQRVRLEGREKRHAEANRQGIEQLESVAQDLELVHERVRLLQEEVSNLLAEATNRNLYVLSIVTTALLPATLITGIWGMNVGGLPWTQDAHGFVWAGLSLVVSILLSLALLRGTRVL
jgi:zinc transporter